MKKNCKLNILSFIIIAILSCHVYGIDGNLIFTNNNCSSIPKIKQEFITLCNTVISLNEKIINYADARIRYEFETEIENKSKPFILTRSTDKPITYSKILGFFNMPEHATASKNYIYNASKIPLTDGYCIAAEGPNADTFKKFIALLGENKAIISISLVSRSEFLEVNNERISKLLNFTPEECFINNIYKDILFDTVVEHNNHSIKLIGFDSNEEASLEYELFLINNEYHLRLYITNWIDNEDIQLSKVIQVILFIKNIQKLDIFQYNNSDLKYVINCNAGVGRAGTFISIWNLIEEYLNKKEISNIADFIVNSRKYRCRFVFNARQYGMIKHLSENLQKYIENK